MMLTLFTATAAPAATAAAGQNPPAGGGLMGMLPLKLKEDILELELLMFTQI